VYVDVRHRPARAPDFPGVGDGAERLDGVVARDPAEEFGLLGLVGVAQPQLLHEPVDLRHR